MPLRKSRTIHFGVDDTPDTKNWLNVVTSALGIDLSDDTKKWPLCLVLYRLSFHPECCISVGDGGVESRVKLTTLQTNLWSWECYKRLQANGKWPPNESAPNSPCLWEETGEAEADEFAAFLSSIPERIPQPVKPNGIMLDGMNVHCWLRGSNGALMEASSNGPNDPATYNLAIGVLNLAQGTLKAPESQNALEAIARYK